MQISDNEIYLLIKYIKSDLWRVVKRLSYIEDARCLKVNHTVKYLIKIILLKHQFGHGIVNYTTKQYTYQPSQLISM